MKGGVMDQPSKPVKKYRTLIISLVIVIVFLGVALVIWAIGQAGTPVDLGEVDVLANSSDECVTCHREASPGIVEQFGHSTMAAAEVACRDCHEVNADYPGAVEHEGDYILASPTTAMCQKCHEAEVAQYYQSRHSLPSWVAVVGSTDLNPDLLAMYEAIPEGSFAPDKARNAIAAIEGPVLTPFTCESCHSIGAPAMDGSVGRCQKCHIRHSFNLEQARKPETCNNCHIGPDHPQWEIYQESAHGIMYATMGEAWNWEAEAGNLSVVDFPAPTCALCHMSGFGTTGTTHDVGDRLSWYLFASISQRRPSWQDNIARMQSVCFECHNENFITDLYAAADPATEQINGYVQASNDLMAPLQEQGLLTIEPFDEPIDFTYFDLWHYWGRVAKFGMWMQGPDYSQWHGVYPLLETMSELEEMVNQKLEAAGATP
jgi:hydroxylamine dehydrogenase